MQTFKIGDATVTVEHEGSDYHPSDMGTRQRYAYSIVTPAWRYDGNDIHSGCNADVDEPDAARSLFSFLAACAESRDYSERGHGTGENGDLFPEHVGVWAQDNDDELSMLSMEGE